MKLLFTITTANRYYLSAYLSDNLEIYETYCELLSNAYLQRMPIYRVIEPNLKERKKLYTGWTEIITHYVDPSGALRKTKVALRKTKVALITK